MTHPAMLAATALLAGALPPLLAYSLSPSATMLNQCAAVALWGWWVVAVAPQQARRALCGPAGSLVLALLLLAAAVLWAMAVALPSSLGLSALGLLAGAVLLVWAGADAATRPAAVQLFAWFAAGLLLAGLLSAGVALAQVFAPGWGEGGLIAVSGLAGRAVGNLRQPNHLCSLLQWALIALVLLAELRWLKPAMAVAMVVLLVWAVELTASRTGAAGLALLALWGALDRRLSRHARWLLLAMPVVYLVAFGAMAAWGHFEHQSIGAAARLQAESSGIDSPNTRGRIWANALALVAQQPWLGVGFGEFNFAWSLTPFPGRPTAFFDHTHNLPLQLAVELGLPLAALVLALSSAALWRAWRRSGQARGDTALAARAACMLVATIGLHSMVEYPLWYAYFLLPAAFAWGFALGVPGAAGPAITQPGPGWTGVAAGILLAAGGVFAVIDYHRVVVIFAPADDSAPLAERIALGQRSPLFAHHADYAAATSGEPGAAAALGFERATHSLLDTRLMVAWSRHLAASGELGLAQALADRLREFRNRDADSFFAECAAGAAQPPFQCQLAASAHGWREYLAAARRR